MDGKEANLRFLYAERLKSNLLVVSRALERVGGLKGEGLAGGREVCRGAFAGLRNEVSLAAHYFAAQELQPLEIKLREAEGNMELGECEKALRCLGQGLSEVTNLSLKYIRVLKEWDMV